MDLPATQQLAQVMSQATAPAFVLGAVAGFVSILLGWMATVVDRIRSLNEIGEDDAARARLKSDIPRLRRRASLLNSAVRLALLSGMCTALLLVVGCERISQVGSATRPHRNQKPRETGGGVGGGVGIR